jgi:aminoglycoside phosphotransferase (APT) family kinase protein
MVVPQEAPSVLQSRRPILEKWLQEKTPELKNLRIVEIAENTSGSGLSNETFFVTAHHDGGEQRLAFRCQPADLSRALFPSYDIPRQFRIMEALHRHSDVPVARTFWLETDTRLIGSPFFAMDFVEGEVPADDPPWQVSGFMVRASDRQRQDMWWSMVERIFAVGQVDWQNAGLAFLRDEPDEIKTFSGSLRYYERCFRNARVGSAAFPAGERMIEWLHDHVPTIEKLSLSWGDAKPGNFIFRNMVPIALMDWEMAGLAEPEFDLATFLVYQKSHESTVDPRYRRPRLAGFGTNRETVDHFEALLGRKVRNFEFYWVFAAFRYLALAQRYFTVLGESGSISRQDAEAYKITNSFIEPIMMVVEDRGSPLDG